MLTAAQKTRLHDIARQSIAHGLESGEPLQVDSDKLDAALRETRATFVTLNKHGRLRGCIGTLEPRRPLAQDVAYHAWAAAFNDTRFPPLQADELPHLNIHISILGTPQTMAFHSEQDLLQQLTPGIDGLILEHHDRRATFLPSVWESIQSRREFLQQLKRKAGLPADYWSDSIRIQRYQVESF
jgi:AmmeMemoRadiSam system protein A